MLAFARKKFISRASPVSMVSSPVFHGVINANIRTWLESTVLESTVLESTVLERNQFDILSERGCDGKFNF